MQLGSKIAAVGSSLAIIFIARAVRLLQDPANIVGKLCPVVLAAILSFHSDTDGLSSSVAVMVMAATALELHVPTFRCRCISSLLESIRPWIS